MAICGLPYFRENASKVPPKTASWVLMGLGAGVGLVVGVGLGCRASQALAVAVALAKPASTVAFDAMIAACSSGDVYHRTPTVQQAQVARIGKTERMRTFCQHPAFHHAVNRDSRFADFGCTSCCELSAGLGDFTVWIPFRTQTNCKRAASIACNCCVGGLSGVHAIPPRVRA